MTKITLACCLECGRQANRVTNEGKCGTCVRRVKEKLCVLCGQKEHHKSFRCFACYRQFGAGGVKVSLFLFNIVQEIKSCLICRREHRIV